MTTDQRLTNYVLGLLPESEAEQLDEASIADDGVAARLRAVEDDLVDAYVRGILCGKTLQSFEQHYLASPIRRDKVAFARRFTLAVDRASVSAPVTPVPRISGRSLWRLTAVAAALFVVSAAFWMQTARLRDRIAAAQAERQALDRHAQELQQEVSDLRAVGNAAAHAAQPPAPAPVAPPIALVLLPQTREVGPVPALVLPPGVERIGFKLRLESREPAAYQIALRDPALDTIVWRSGWVAASNGSLTLSLPTLLFKPRHYSFEVSMRDAHERDADLVASYAFEIAPR